MSDWDEGDLIDDRDEIDDMPYRLHYYADHDGVRYAIRLGSWHPYPADVDPFLEMNCLSGDECTEEHPTGSGIVQLALITAEEYETHKIEMDKDDDD